MRWETEVPKERVPVVKCRDGLARITLKELAITHCVKNGTLQNACSTRPRVVVGLEKSALMHIARLMNSLVKGPKRMMTKVQWLYWRSMSVIKEQGDLFWMLTHLIHDNWVDRRAAKKGRHAFGTHMVYQEPFSQIHMHPLQLVILKNWTLHGGKPLRNRFTCLQRRRVKAKHQFRIRDASQDREPKIQSSSVEETL